jgi:hypothetical protein
VLALVVSADGLSERLRTAVCGAVEAAIGDATPPGWTDGLLRCGG